MSETDFIQELKKLKSQILTRVISAFIGGLLIMLVGGGWTMAKIFNVKGKADKTYVDTFYGDMMRLVENRTLVLEQMVKAEKEMNTQEITQLQRRLNELDIKWQQHMSYHMERTRGVNSTPGTQ